MKEHRHLTSAEVELLLEGTLSVESIRLAVRFLMAGCTVCMEIARQGVLGPVEPGLESRPEGPPAKRE